MRRIHLGKTQSQVAQDGGQDESGNDVLTQSNVADAETGRVPLLNMGFGKIIALARGLDWTLGELQDATGIDMNVPRPVVLTPVADRVEDVYPLQAAANSNVGPLDYGEALRGTGHPKRLRVFLADGDEMQTDADNSIRSGDSLYVNLDDRTPEVGRVYVITAEGRAHVRRYAQGRRGAVWRADNRSDHDDIHEDEATVVGRVYRVVGDLDENALLN